MEDRKPEEVIDMITESLMPGRRDALRQLFNAHGARSPWILWSPRPEDMHSPILRRIAEICEDLSGEDGLLRDSAFSLDLFGPLADWIMVVSPKDGEYRYDHYGRGIAEHYGRDMTGETTADFTSHIAQFFKALYFAAAERREWVLSEHEPPAAVFVRSWRRLIIPLTDDSGEKVVRFVVANLPESELRAGLELMVDPVFVCDADQIVHYANRAAQRMFSFDAAIPNGTRFTSLTGLDLENLPSPSDMLASQSVDDSLQLALKGGIAERLVMTVSAAEHRGVAFYIVVLRQIGS